MRSARRAADGGAAAPDAATTLLQAGPPQPHVPAGLRLSRARVVHPADVFTVVVAWLAVLAVCVAAVLFGQTARTDRRRRPRSAAARVGLFVSLSGPWLALLGAAGAGAVTGAWLMAAAAGACGVVVATLVGVVLLPR